MKGWIKVHKLSEIDNKSHIMYVRAEDVVQVLIGVLATDTSVESTCICLRGEEDVPYAVDETVEEVLALIKEAEKSEEEKSLLTLLKSVKAECDKNEECETCRWDGLDPCPWEMSLNSRPLGWELEKIPEEYR